MASGGENPRSPPVRLTWNTVSPSRFNALCCDGSIVAFLFFPTPISFVWLTLSLRPSCQHGGERACSPPALPPKASGRLLVCPGQQSQTGGPGHLCRGSPTFTEALRSQSGPCPGLSVPHTAGTAHLWASRGTRGTAGPSRTPQGAVCPLAAAGQATAALRRQTTLCHVLHSCGGVGLWRPTLRKANRLQSCPPRTSLALGPPCL